MSQGITKSLDSMSQAELVGLRYNYVMNSLSLAQGDFAKTERKLGEPNPDSFRELEEFMSVIGQGLYRSSPAAASTKSDYIRAYGCG